MIRPRKSGGKKKEGEKKKIRKEKKKRKIKESIQDHLDDGHTDVCACRQTQEGAELDVRTR